jgi:hypothetical protein
VIAGARYPSIGDSALELARFREGKWEAMTQGLFPASLELRDLTVHRGRLYLGGDFRMVEGFRASALAVWEDSQWVRLPTPPEVTVLRMLSTGDRLAVAWQSATDHRIEVVLIDGEEQQSLGWLGRGSGRVELAVVDGGLYVWWSRSAEDPGFACWRDGRMIPLESPPGVTSMVSWRNGVAIAAEVLGGTGVLFRDGDEEVLLGGLGSAIDGEVLALLPFPGGLYAGGAFTGTGDVPGTRFLARFDGTAWHPLGSPNGAVADLTTLGSSLVVAGTFDSIGGIAARFVAAWNGFAFSPVGSGCAGGVERVVEHEGELIAAGGFLQAGGVDANRIARWDGAAWHPLGDGLEEIEPMHDAVTDLESYRGELFAAGAFHRAGGIPLETTGLARWNGSEWARPGAGFPSDARWVGGLAVARDLLFASVIFHDDHEELWQWDGGLWAPGPWGCEADVRGLFSAGDDLLVSWVSRLSGEPNLTLYDGSRWSTIEGPLHNIHAVAVWDGAVWFGGGFLRSPGERSPQYLARWDGLDEDPVPVPALRAIPNPARGPVLLLPRSPAGEPSSLRIFDVTGRLVLELPTSGLGGGLWVWNGRDASGRSVPSGMYWARLSAAGGGASARIVVTR